MKLRSTRSLMGVLLNVALALSVATSSAFAADAEPLQRTLFTNVDVFDGNSKELLNDANVLVEGNLIEQVSQEAIEAKGATVIDGGGRTLTPGFIDAHRHVMVNEPFEPLIYDRTQVYVGALATVNAKAMLHRGFTTIRDMGGPSQGLKDVFFSSQFFAFSATAEMAGYSGETAVKYNEAKAGAETGFKRAKKHGLKMAWGTGTFGSLDIQKYQKDEWVARAKYYSPYEILVQPTSLNAELLERAGKRHPYQQGPPGVIKPGAYADIIIVDGNPLEDISLLSDPEKNLKVIMKDGMIFKNALK